MQDTQTVNHETVAAFESDPGKPGLKTNTRMLLVLGCFLLSGLAGLIYETAWTQQFALVFGTSELAIAAVLAAYMAGLAAGAGVAARKVERLRRPLLTYALLELGIALTALLVPLGLDLASTLQIKLLGSVELPPESASLASAVFYLGAAFVVLLIPTALMGASLPVLARHAVEKDTQIGSRVGWLYAINTAGAATGILLAAYGLLPRFGLSGTILAAVLVNVLVFFLALLLARISGANTLPAIPASIATHKPTGPGWILPAILVSGFVSFTYEVLWTRLLSHLLGGTLYAFATMLATFLCGITIGAAVASFFAKTSASARKGFIIALLGVALCSLAAFNATDYLPDIAKGLSAGGSSFVNIALIAAATLLPGALFIGATFPFAVRILAGSANEAGVASGQVFAWNTTGAIAGAVGAGFILLPGLQFSGTVLVAIGTGIALATLVALGPAPRLWRLGITSLGAILVVTLWTPGTPESVIRTSPLTGKAIPGELVFTAVGRSATTLLVKQGSNWRLTTNGLPESMIQPPGGREVGTAIAHWLSLLPLASRPDAESALVIGFGAGRTLEAFAPSVKEIQVIELEPEVIRANLFVAGQRSENPFDDPRIKVHLNDARSGLQLADRRFDAIISQPSHPWTGGASHLFTSEFFQLVQQRLTPGGVFVQWIGLPFIDEQLLLSLLASLNEVFDHVELYQPPPGGAVLFLASMETPMTMTSATKGLANGGKLWHRLGIFNPEDILAARLLKAPASRRLAQAAPVNRDNHNLIRLRPPGKDLKAMNQRSLFQLAGEMDALNNWQPEDGSLYMVRRLLAVKQSGRARQLAEGIEDTGLAATASALVDLTMRKRKQGEQALWQSLSLDPASEEAFFALVKLYQAEIIKDEAPALLVARLASDPDARSIVRGWKLSTSRQTAGIRNLEPQLAQIPASHPLYVNAVRLRVAWRLASGNAQLALEGISLYDPILALGANAHELMIRARLGQVAKDAQIVIASLYEVIGKLPAPARQGPAHKALIRQALKMLDAVTPEPGLESTIEQLRERLTKLGSDSKPGSDSNAAHLNLTPEPARPNVLIDSPDLDTLDLTANNHYGSEPRTISENTG